MSNAKDLYIKMYKSRRKLLSIDIESYNHHVKSLLETLGYDDLWFYKYHKEQIKQRLEYIQYDINDLLSLLSKI